MTPPLRSTVVTIELTKPGVDLGIVITDSEASLAFYCGTLGLEHVADMPMPIAGGGTMHRVQCGNSVLKLVNLTDTPATRTTGGIPGAIGFRYVTLSVGNSEEAVAACEAVGAPIAVPVSEIRPGVRIAMIEDPDGNWVELLQVDDA